MMRRLSDGLGGRARIRSSQESETAWPAADAAWVRGDEAIMGTAIQVELWHEDVETAERAVAAVRMKFADAVYAS